MSLLVDFRKYIRSQERRFVARIFYYLLPADIRSGTG